MVQEDLEPFLPANRVREAFEMLDFNNDGKVSLQVPSSAPCNICPPKISQLADQAGQEEYSACW